VDLTNHSLLLDTLRIIIAFMFEIIVSS